MLEDDADGLGVIDERGCASAPMVASRAWRDGTAGIVLDPLDLMARLAALVPPPRVNLVRYHGVFAPASSSSPPCGWRV